MAYLKFSIVSIKTDLKEQSVYITFNRQFDSDTINVNNLMIASQENGSMATYDLDVSDDLKTAIIKFRDTPLVNSTYAILINESIKDLEGNTLEKSLFRNIRFESGITSTIDLLFPANFEIIPETSFSWNEVGDDLVNSFRLQVSKENVFHTLEIDTLVVGRTTIKVTNSLTPGQYYYRVRAEVDKEYGLWSEVRTFLIQDPDPVISKEVTTEEVVEDNTVLSEETGDLTIEDWTEARPDRLTLEQQPDNGVTPLSFMFNFSEDIASDSITISIVRSDF